MQLNEVLLLLLLRSSTLTTRMVQALGHLRHLPLPPLQRVDEMIDKGWIRKINILCDSTVGTLYTAGFTLSERLLQVRLERRL